MLLVITYSQTARQSLRNITRRYEDCVVRHFGRATLFEETEFAAFQALRLRAKHGDVVQIERTRPFDEVGAVPESVRRAAHEYEQREEPALPYPAFCAETAHPEPEAMRGSEL